VRAFGGRWLLDPAIVAAGGGAEDQLHLPQGAAQDGRIAQQVPAGQKVRDLAFGPRRVARQA
jgi:hypothetical protein